VATTDAEEPAVTHERRDEDEGGTLAVLPLRGGEHVGRYVILYRLGKGGMGVVFAAYDPQLDRKVAIKLMRPRGRGRTGTGQAAMLREAQALARLSHPHVVAIHDVGVLGNQVFVAMDFLEGDTLRRWAASERRTVADIVRVYLQAGEGIAAAHRAGIVHRDFKPDNVIVTRDSSGGTALRVQVLDFGLARMRDAESHDTDDEDDQPMRPAGTPMYMAPEQHQGRALGPSCDQFAFCVSLYETLWRRLPFSSDTGSVARAILEGRLVDPPRGGGVPHRLRRAILRGLSRMPSDRHASMQALLDELRATQRRGRRRRIAAVVGLVGIASVGAWLFGRSARVGDLPCEDASHRLDGVWDDERRAAVEHSILVSGRMHAQRTAAGVAARLDRWTSQWSASHAEACAATRVRHEQSEELLDLRMACLGGRRQELLALVDLFAAADVDLVDRALEAAESLPAIEPCDDVVAMRTRDPLPADEQTRAEIEDVQARLAQAGALQNAGKLSDALAIAELATRRAEDLGWRPLQAACGYRTGEILDDLARPEDAEAALRKAALAAEAARDDALLADSRVLLVSVVGARLQRTREGELWAELAGAALDRLGEEPAREARLENGIATMLSSTGRPEHVLEHMRRALALASASESDNELWIASLNINMASTLVDLGQLDEALERAQTSLKIFEAAHGPDHPQTANAQSAIGAVHDQRGDLDEALAWYERSHGTLSRVLGEDNPRTLDALSNVAIVTIELGDTARAVKLFDRALAGYVAAYGEEHGDVAQAHQNLGGALRIAGEIDRALEHQRRALALRERLLGPEDPRVARSLVGVANILEDDLARPDEALGLRQRALALEEKTYGREHPALTLSLSNLAHNLLMAGDADQALRTAERAQSLSIDASVRPDVRAFAGLVLARVLAERGREPERVEALVAAGRASLGPQPPPSEAKLIAAIERAQRRASASGG
jgi:eukaryotic-like serine/threonine-protein kinase